MYHRFTLLDARLLLALTVLITGCTPDANPQAVAATKTEAQNQPIAKRQQTVQQSVQHLSNIFYDIIQQKRNTMASKPHNIGVSGYNAGWQCLPLCPPSKV